MKEVLEDDNFDPRRNAHVESKKNGQFTSDRKWAFIPKNPLTALYLCHAYDVPYATFKRWKNEAFVTTPYWNTCETEIRLTHTMGIILLPSLLDALVAEGGLCAGAIVVHQEDNSEKNCKQRIWER
jgi:hypothetical protein